MNTVESLEKENARLRAELRRLESHRATTFRDHLTGLSNRHYFEDRLQQELARAKRWNWVCSVLLMNIDSFKQLNQTYGHTVGDAILVWLARFLERSVREIDIPCRVGADEFAIILPYTDPHGCSIVTQRLRSWIQEEDTPHGIPFYVSVGTATFPAEATTLSDLLGVVDDSLYLDKKRKCAASEIRAREGAAHARGQL
ncbi:MAG: GGDEF domain-containing protein [Deltaproteobacteria bacterium]|nr:GGDEF domain-containing protein [Deltaproteobacteria bacterium]